MRIYTIFPDALREPQKPGVPYPLGEHGENLASVLREMRREGAAFFPDLIKAMSKVVPGVHDVQVIQAGGYLVVKLKHLVSEAGADAAWFELSQESDGTLRVLGLLTALFQEPSPSLIAIEEPELTIHPGALAVLADILKEAAQRTQIILTTHSPDLIDCLPLESLRAVQSVGGVTAVGIVTQHQREAVMKGLFSAGELHRIEGLEPARSRE
jgi:predicted ATPase